MEKSKDQPLWDRFPEHRHLINQLSSENSTFNELVRDYTDALETLSKWQVSDHPRASERVEEYARLSKELEVEIEKFLIDAVRSLPI